MPLDKTRALADFQISEQEYDTLLAEFVDQAEEHILTIKKALSIGDIKEAAETAHSIKGIAGNLRLDTCFAIAQGIESQLKKGVTEYMDRRVADIKIAIADIRDSINA